jgi:putative ABC transport system permease protein
MTLTVLVSVAASVLAGGLLVASDGPFDHAFAAQRGAHLTAQFDGTRTTRAQLATTTHGAGVTAWAGPFSVVSARPSTVAATAGVPAGLGLSPLTIVGRPSAGGPVDDVTLLTGRWATGPGQLVLAADVEGVPPLRVGDRLRFPALPGGPTLTVVGTARSVSRTADAWVAPAQIPGLTAPGTTAGYEMLYRFAAAGTDAQIEADRAAIAAAVPGGALTGAQSYLAARLVANGNTAAFVPFVAAFGVLGLALSALIIWIVISGAVGAAIRRIGVLKALGFTPGQVARAYVWQALLPASVGVVVGVVCGNLAAAPVLREQADAYDGVAPGIPGWLDLAVAATMLAIVAGAALGPALRAARLGTIEAISAGRADRAGQARRAHRLAGRLALPRALSLGLAQPFARPARSAVLAAAIGLGVIGVTFAVGLGVTLGDIQRHGNPDDTGRVVVGPARPDKAADDEGAAPPALPDLAAVSKQIAAQPGTRRFYGVATADASVAGLAGAVEIDAYEGDSSWAAYQMISGSWLRGPGEAVVGTRFLRAAGVKVGDTVTVTNQGRATRLRIVGEALNLRHDGMNLMTTTSSVGGLGLDPRFTEFHVDLRPGTDLATYLNTLNGLIGPGAEARAHLSHASTVILTMETLITMLTLGLAVVAALGVLNTLLLDTRERVHDLGVYKALGMTPRQTIGMVVTSVAGLGLLAGLVGVPAGIALHHVVVPMMGHAVGTGIPPADIAVFRPGVAVLLALGGLLIAVAGALAPATWAARTRTVTALRAE